MLVRDRVFSNSQGYVKKYDIVNKKSEKGAVTVTVRADIGKADLDKDLVVVQGLIKRMGKSKLVVILNEQSIDDKGVSTRSEMLATALTDEALQRRLAHHRRESEPATVRAA